jgi:serine/threonine-protein kinase
MASSTSTRVLPSKFGRYALFDFIGKGGMAEIYLARAQSELGASRLCVVKQILPELAEHPQFAEMLIYEAKLAARLSHANVVQVFDLGKSDERLFIAMDYVEGFDLNELLKRCSKQKVPLPLEFALLIIGEALKGLGYAHRRTDDDGKPLGIVHRDMSPSNILVSFEGEVKLCDFGIARATEVVDVAAAAEPDADTSIKGKAGYMSPEHARGEKIDARADLFAIGIVLWELLAGRRLYRRDDDLSLIEQARRADIPELPRRGIANEDELRAVVAKALSIDRDGRYATAHAMHQDLEAYVAGAKLVASPLRLGEWLVANFGTDMVSQRRARERALAALDLGAPVKLELLPPKTPAPSPVVDRTPSSIAGAAMDVSPRSAPLLPIVPDVTTPRRRSPVTYVVAALVAAVLVVVALYAMKRV